jgi:hypothetical protein
MTVLASGREGAGTVKVTDVAVLLLNDAETPPTVIRSPRRVGAGNVTTVPTGPDDGLSDVAFGRGRCVTVNVNAVGPGRVTRPHFAA